MNYLDPENIESIEVLKDGASAAIYGIEAGNGVILVTTKSGGGQGKIFYNFQYTTQSIANYPHMMNAEQWMDYQVESGACRQEDFLYDGVTDTDWGKLMFEKGTMPRPHGRCGPRRGCRSSWPARTRCCWPHQWLLARSRT